MGAGASLGKSLKTATSRNPLRNLSNLPHDDMMKYVFLLALCLATPAQADISGPPLLPPQFREAALDAIARLRRPAGDRGGCSAVLVAPHIALTAAHCAPHHQPRNLRFHPEGPVPFIVPVAEVIHALETDTDNPIQATADDLALLRLEAPVPAEIAVPMPIGPFDPAQPHGLFGFLNSARDESLRGHEPSQVAALPEGAIASDCAVRSGQSGGALVRFTEDGPVLAGIIVATVNRNDEIRSLSAPLSVDRLPQLAEVMP